MPNTSGPKCPNHCVPLTLTNTRGIGICPISNCRFEYKADEDTAHDKMRVTAFGDMVKETNYKLTPLDGIGG